MTQTISEQPPASPVEEYREQLAIQGEFLAEKVRELIHEGNVRRLIIKHDGHTVVEIPVTWGVIGAVLSPTLAAVGAAARWEPRTGEDPTEGGEAKAEPTFGFSETLKSTK